MKNYFLPRSIAVCDGVICSAQAVLEIRVSECHFPSTTLKTGKVLPAERAQCFSTTLLSGWFANRHCWD